MAQVFLQVLWTIPTFQRKRCVNMPQHMEVEILQSRHFLLSLTAHDAHHTRRLNGSVRSEADKGKLPISFRHLRRPGQDIDLVIGPVFLSDLSIVVQAAKLAVAQAVLNLLLFGPPQDHCQRVAEVHGSDYLPFSGPDFRLMPRPVVADAPPNREILFVQVNILPGEGADFPNPKSGVVGNLDGQQGRVVFLFQKVLQRPELLMGEGRHSRGVPIFLRKQLVFLSGNNENEVLEYYAYTIRVKIKELFPQNQADKTTIINGTIFVSKDDKAVEGNGAVFHRILKRFNDFGTLENIDYDFKSNLFETFLKGSISKKNWGQYFTPLKVVRAIVIMVDLLPSMGVCDPACGVGKFLLEPICNDLHRFFLVEDGKCKPQIALHGFDKGVAELLNNTFLLQTNSILGTLARPEADRYDLILTNPPYVMSGSSNLKEEIGKN